MSSTTRKAPAAPELELQGQIERIVYCNEESGYTVARIAVPRGSDAVTVVGTMLAPRPGEELRMRGMWTCHPRYGERFKIISYETLRPATAHGIERYLGSGLIRGIGPVMAKRIVDLFGADTLEIIEKKPEQLAEVEGIGAARVEMIRQAWGEQQEIRNLMLFLQSHDVSSGLATRIFRHYGSAAIKILEENPYRLATDIFGIGFLSADRIAAKLGMPPDAPQRIEAGILFALQQQAEDGHVYVPYELLVQRCMEVLGAEREAVLQAFGALALAKKLIIEDVNDAGVPFAENSKAVYLAMYYNSEQGIAERLRAIIAAPAAMPGLDARQALSWVEGQLAIDLAERQKTAVSRALQKKVLVITGGPGTGKTTILQAVLRICARHGVRSLLAAPTGRAAKRMAEATGRQAQTIHRLLKFNVAAGGFERDEHNPLDCDLLVIDEASMIDTLLMYGLLRAVPQEASLILVGDVDQLPSVGAGSVLSDIITSGAAEVVQLNEIFRQAAQSMIIVNAHRINQGSMPLLKAGPADAADFYFIEKEQPDDVQSTILEVVSERIPRRFGLNPLDGIQVVTPMHRGAVGTASLNAVLQKALNPAQQALSRGSQTLSVGDKIMQLKNNYDKEVFNGDIGRIAAINADERAVMISFDGRLVTYDYADLDEISLAYAISVHKAQGSEFPAVVMPIVTQHYLLLQRNLLYTAVTRGRQLVVLVGTKKALAIAVHNDQTRRRYTGLCRRLGQG